MKKENILKKRRGAWSQHENQTKGVSHEIKGKVKEIAGKIIYRPTLKVERLAEKMAGKTQKKVG